VRSGREAGAVAPHEIGISRSPSPKFPGLSVPYWRTGAGAARRRAGGGQALLEIRNVRNVPEPVH
jgi:hypothetical protein